MIWLLQPESGLTPRSETKFHDVDAANTTCGDDRRRERYFAGFSRNTFLSRVYQLFRRHFDEDALSDFVGLFHADAQSWRQRRRLSRKK